MSYNQQSLDKINDSTNEGNNVNIKKSASTIIDCNNNNNNNVGNNSSHYWYFVIQNLVVEKKKQNTGKNWYGNYLNLHIQVHQHHM